MKRFTPIIFTVAILVGTLAPFTVSLTKTGAATLAPATANAQVLYTPQDDAGNHLPGCSITGKDRIKNCLANILYYIPFSIGAWGMGVAAKMFDMAAALTLSSKLYTVGTFLEQGWRITRDFSNIFFILILLFVALSLVLGIEIGHANPKKMLGTVIVIAIVINFSFFITEVIIDTGNSLALAFYNQVVLVSEKDNTLLTQPNEEDQLAKSGSVYIKQVRPLSIGLVRSFTPQVLSDKLFYDKLSAVSNGSSGFFSTDTKPGATGTVDAEIMIPLLLMIGLMFCVVAYSFAIGIVSLIGRLVSLWVAIIFAPFAFITYIIPSARHISDIGWDDWFKKLLTNAFAAPIYFFYLLLISLLARTSIIPDSSRLAALSPGLILILILIQFAIITTLLIRATKSLKKASGEIGEMVFKAAGALGKVALGVGGIAIGTAAGAAAVAGRGVLGGTANRWLNNERLQERAANLNGQYSGFQQWQAKQAMKLLSGATKSSFDIRQNGLANTFSKTTGIGLDSFGKFSVASTAGGKVAAIERLAKKDQEFMDLFRTSKNRKDRLRGVWEDRDGAQDDAEARVTALREAEKRLDTANRNLEKASRSQANGGSTYFRNGVQIDQATAQAELLAVQNQIQAQFGVQGQPPIDLKAEISTLGATINNLNKGIRDATTGRQLLYNDPRYATEHQDEHGVWQAGATIKANGMPVTAEEINNNIAYERGDHHAPRTFRTESLSMAQLKALYEEEDKVLSRSYLHSVNEKTGFQTHVTYDKLGNIKESHLLASPRQGARNMARAFGEVLTSMQVGGVLGATVGTAAAPVIGTAVGAAVGAAVGGLSRAIKELATSTSQTAADAAHHLEAKAPGHAHAEHAVYHSPSSGLFAAFKSLFDSAGAGGGHGGGGHGGGGDHGGGGHH